MKTTFETHDQTTYILKKIDEDDSIGGKDWTKNLTN